jgi:hypothetical protein
MPFSIQRRLGRASCRALLFSFGLVAGCAQNQPATNSSGSGGSSGGTAVGTGGSGSGGFQDVGSGGSVASGGSSGAAGVIGSGGIVGSGGSVTTGTGGTGTGDTGVGGFSTGGSGTGGSAAGGAAGGGTGGATGGIGGASAGTSGGSAGAGARPAPSADPTTFGLNGPSKCAAGTFAICEDFEATAVGAMPTGWTKEGTWATVVSATDKARGSHSLQIAVGTQNNERGFLNKTAAQLGPLATKHYGRIFFKLQNPPTKFVHWDFFHGPGPYGANNTNDVRWGFTGTHGPATQKVPGPLTYLFNVQTTTGGKEFGQNSPVSVQLVYDTWTCAEWLLDSTVAGGGEARFWVNGTEVTNMHQTGAQAQIPVFSRYGIGWELFNSTDTASTAYIDEVVFDSQRIGCNN